MPVPNELTPEEEREFTDQGLAPLGEGREPLSEEQQGQQQQRQDDEGEQQQQQADRPRDPATGRFLSAAEIEADRQRQESTRQGQQQEQGQQQQEQGQQEPKTVPLAALHETRQRLSQVAQRAQLAENRLNALLSRQQGTVEKPQMPSLEENPAEYILALEQRLNEFVQERQVDQETRQIDQAIESDEDLFKQSRPDYDTASDYYVQSRARELLQFYPPQEAQRMMMDEARAIARESWSRGRSAGETIYTLAMARGYNPNAPQREPQQQQQQGQQQQQRGGPSATSVVDSLKRGQSASRSLSGGSGAPRTQDLNAEALLAMNDEEFEEYLALGSKGANARFASIG